MTTLAQLIQNGPLTYQRFLDLAVKITDKVRAFHDNGVTLGTIAAETIFVDDDDQIIVADPESTQVGRTNVQPYYSPEQLSEQELDARSDLFSLGVLFFQMLTGRFPFGSGSVQAQLDAIAGRMPERDLLTRDDIHLEARLVIAKLLEPSCTDRFTNIEELLATLREIRGDNGHKVAIEDVPDRHSPRTYLVLALITLILVVFWVVISALHK
jgi:eukaryotic-like serine/threonine-protein kinase